MKVFLIIHLIILSIKVTQELYVPPIWRPQMEIIPPSGLRFILVDSDYILVGFHYSINEPLYNDDPGWWNFDVTEKIDNVWKHENPRADVWVGDTVNYWINARPNSTRIDENLLNQSYVFEGPSSTAPVTSRITTGQRGIVSMVTPANTIGTIAKSNVTRNAVPGTMVPTSTSTVTDVIRSTVSSTSNSSYTNNISSNLIYLIVFSTLGVIFMVCVTVIVICCIRQRGNRRKSKEIQNRNVHFKNNLSDNVFQSQGLERDKRNRNMNVDHVALNQLQHNTTNRNIITEITTFHDTNPKTISRHLYDDVDNSVNPATSQYDYTDNQRAVYDLPKDFVDKFKPENKYDVLSRNREDNQEQYQQFVKEHKSDSYLEIV